MKPSISIFLILFALILVSCYPSATVNFNSIYTDSNVTQSPVSERSTRSLTPESSIQFKSTTSTPETTLTPKPTPTPTQTPDPFKDFYGCQMKLEFISGPLEGQSTEFEILDKNYFQDKGDKFAVGKGTAVFYEKDPYLILHSSYVNGNILRPMEAEFIRKYLENWGNKGNEHIQDQFNALSGSQAVWKCNGDIVLNSKLVNAVRLSHEASNQLWLEPHQIEEILTKREGTSSEWIGEKINTASPSLYLGFCGWGPSSIMSGRYTYFRYILNFEFQNFWRLR